MTNFNTDVDNILREKITSQEEYVRWVRRWKRVHSNMVTRIQMMKGSIRNVGFSIRGSEPVNQIPGIFVMGFTQHNLREDAKVAKAMYDVRTTHKELLKTGTYPKLVLHMDGPNSKNAVEGFPV